MSPYRHDLEPVTAGRKLVVWIALAIIVELLAAILLVNSMVSAPRSADVDPVIGPPSGSLPVMSAERGVEASPTPAPVNVTGSEGTRSVLTTPMPATHQPTGWATWYDDGPGHYAAVHDWRWGDDPYVIRVCADGRCTSVTVRDYCACGARHGEPTVVDLSPAAFRELAPLSRGIVKVRIARRTISLPATDTAP